MKAGVLLFCHGARDPNWARPFEAVLEQVREQAPDAEVSLAFLEFMTPGILQAGLELAELGCAHLTKLCQAAKLKLLSMIRSFERAGAPVGVAFWSKAIRHMGIRIDTPDEEIARIPKTGPVVMVANHPHGLVDGMIMAEMVSRVRPDFRILTRSLTPAAKTTWKA